MFKLQHDCHASAPRDAQPPQAAPAPHTSSSKPPSTELKPEKLTHDASTSTFRTWKKQFRAYFDSAQLGALPCSKQQAYLCNCLDTILHARIDREASNTTPVYTPIAGLLTCMSILDQNYPQQVQRAQHNNIKKEAGLGNRIRLCRTHCLSKRHQARQR